MADSLDSFNSLLGYSQPSSPRLSDNQPPELGPYKGQIGGSISAPNSFGGERFRGSVELPLTSEGLQAAHQMAMKVARKGGVDQIKASSLGRTVQTAQALSKYTHAPITYVGESLHPWHLGALEGKPVDKEHLDLMNHMIQESPDLPFPGRGEGSTRDGESFNSFKARTLPFLKDLIRQASIKPDEKTAVITHSRVGKLLKAYMTAGLHHDNNDIDLNEMTRHSTSDTPGSINRLHVDPYAGPQLSSVDLNSPGHLPGGVYFIRHEATSFNKKDPQGS